MKSAILFVFVLAITSYSFQQALTTGKIEMVEVQGGTFQMGSEKGEENERPVHAVTLNSFYMGKYEVTQQLWKDVMGADRAHFKGRESCPVEDVAIADIDSFIVRLNARLNARYRLPTEAEWEYAAMGGNKSKGYRYAGSDSLFEVGWTRDNGDNKTHPVGQKKPNELGIYDMAGNVWELCSDWWDPGYYTHSPPSNPRNDAKAVFRVVRGGSWLSGKERCYNKARNRNVYDHYRKHNFGFRLVLDR